MKHAPLALFLSAPLLGATPSPVAPSPGDILHLRLGSLEELLPDARDAGLRSALSLADDRILELMAEFGDRDAAMAAVVLQEFLPLLGNPLELRMGVPDDFDPNGPPAFYVSLEVSQLEAQVGADVQATFVRLFTEEAGMIPEPFAGQPGWLAVPTPAGMLGFGTSTSAAGTSFGVTFGEVPAPSAPAPEGEAMTMRFDLEGQQALFDMMLASMGPEAEELRPFLALLGLDTDAPLGAEIGLRYADGRSMSRMVFKNWVPLAERMGTLVTEPLVAEHLAMVPADATWASLGRSDLSGLLSTFSMMPDGEMMLDMMLSEVESEFGLHLQQDFLDHLGTVSGVYTADSTGGGGLLSMVMFAELSDAAGMAHGLGLLESTIDELGATEADGYVRVRHWNEGEASCSSLTFPGMPIPIEPSWAISGDWLFAAASPQALHVALAQASGTTPGLLANPGFRAAGGDRASGCLTVQYQDTARFVAEGYGMSTLAFAALGNAVRSPRDPSIQSGPIMPGFADLVSGAQPSLSLGRVQGNDLVMESLADASQCVNITALLGSPMGAVLPVFMAAGASSTFLMARSPGGMMFPDYYDYAYAQPFAATPTIGMVEPLSPHDEWVQDDLTNVKLAIDQFRVSNAGHYPGTLADLTARDATGNSFLFEMPTDPWGNSYEYMPPDPDATGGELWLYSLGADGEPGGVNDDADIFFRG